jgi:hypothetical protein
VGGISRLVAEALYSLALTHDLEWTLRLKSQVDNFSNPLLAVAIPPLVLPPLGPDVVDLPVPAREDWRYKTWAT